MEVKKTWEELKKELGIKVVRYRIKKAMLDKEKRPRVLDLLRERGSPYVYTLVRIEENGDLIA